MKKLTATLIATITALLAIALAGSTSESTTVPVKPLSGAAGMRAL
ncbi:hypothetical protein [Planobispora takensis]